MKYFKWIIDMIVSTCGSDSSKELFIEFKRNIVDTVEKRTRKLEINIRINTVLIISLILIIVYIDV